MERSIWELRWIDGGRICRSWMTADEALRENARMEASSLRAAWCLVEALS